MGDRARQALADLDSIEPVETSEAFLRSVFDTVPEAVITIDDHGLILTFNKIAEEMFGYRAGEVVGRNVDLLMDPSLEFAHDSHLAHYRNSRSSPVMGKTRRVLGRRKDGTLFPHALYVGQAKCSGRRVFTGFMRDLTAQEEAEAHLHELQSELIRMSRVSAAGTLAAALAHELNQPLAAIANYVQSCVASGQHLPQAMQEALAEAGQEALRAGEIVHRLREFVSKGALDKTFVSPRRLAEVARDLGAIGAKSRSIRCEILMRDDLPSVLVDQVQIQQVLLNLIRNAFDAIRHFGRITIAATEMDGMVRFCVADDGPGIDPALEHSVFEAFISSKSDGMGMGLAICRTIVEAHGGQMWQQSPLGGGAAFYFTLPIAEAGDE